MGTAVYSHPYSSILEKADGILQRGRKYNPNLFMKPKQQSAIKNTDNATGAISFDSLLKNHNRTKQSWLKKIKTKQIELNESFKDLDTIQSEEVEKHVPVQINTQKKI
mmetsp:Transcript_787/g.654  ORF Transcript_787/g.654 Transcript_787/m.654 type:complete len:108 (-) Transcript_787:606-929(-)